MSTEMSELTVAGGGSRRHLDFDEMELTLGLPGESRKRRFLDIVDLKIGSSDADESDGECSDFYPSRSLLSKERVIGWPPVRSSMKITKNTSRKYVKVAVDGAPYLRKVDLESYTCYRRLLRVIQDMFPNFTIHDALNEKKIADHVNRSEHVPTYEDKDGDWMLVGDVPWKMFVETCKRIRLMKSTEAINQLVPKTFEKR